MQKLVFKNKTLDLRTPTIMGILNVTPDSFSDGGQFHNLNKAVEQALKMQQQGADIIDVGGESTRPGATHVSEHQELDRVIPVIQRIREETDIPISVDTSKPVVMNEAVQAGANMINDVRALQAEGALQMAVDCNVPVCLMHMQGNPTTMQQAPHYSSVVNQVTQFLSSRVEQAIAAGVNREKIIIDPGFGFGKTLENNYELLSNLNHFRQLGLPILVGMSRKSMIGNLLNKPIDERLAASIACATIACIKGAHIIRVHDVAETKDALRIVEATVMASQLTSP